jgi:hypothetical protein
VESWGATHLAEVLMGDSLRAPGSLNHHHIRHTPIPTSTTAPHAATASATTTSTATAATTPASQCLQRAQHDSYEQQNDDFTIFEHLTIPYLEWQSGFKGY